MLRKILLLMSLIFILSIGVACAAERTYEVTDGGCIVSLPEQYAVTVVERPTDPNDELGVQVAQLSISDPVNKSMTMHVMVESSKLTKELTWRSDEGLFCGKSAKQRLAGAGSRR